MSRLEQLIKKLCPDGVEYKALFELGEFYGGLNGKSKDDFTNGNAKFITYMNIFSNLSLEIDVDDTVRIADNERQNTIQYGDVLFTGSSETPDECGMSSVLTSTTEEKLYLNSFCFGFRFFDRSLFLPEFSKYVFRSTEIRKQIRKTASGVTRFNVSKKKMQKVIIPLPPLPVQEEIVRILDNFTELTAELAAKLTVELTARQLQYEYYCKQALATMEQLEYTSIRSLGKWIGGSTPSMAESDYWEKGELPWVSSKDMKMAILIDTQDHVTKKAIEETSLKLLPKNTVAIVARSGILKHTLPVVFIPFEATVNQDIKALISNDSFLPQFAHFVVLAYRTEILSKAKKQGGTVDSLDMDAFYNYQIPVSRLKEEQERIVAILDRFSRFYNDISESLQTEIKAREQQYEYYRNKLLTFKEKEDCGNE